MEGIPTLRDLLSPRDWFMKVGLKDAYFTFPIDPGHHQYLRFVGQGEMPVHIPPLWPTLYSPHLYQSDKTSDDPFEVMGSQDYHLYLILAETSEQAYQYLETLLRKLQSLGFVVNRQKLVFTASQEIEAKEK